MTAPLVDPRPTGSGPRRADRPRIVVLGDSLAMPHVDAAGVPTVYWEQTWPRVLEAVLEERGVSTEVVNCAQRARTVESLCGDGFLEDVVMKRPRVLILQVGVVDCAPRIFSRFEKRVLHGMPARLRNSIIARRARKRAQLTARDPLAKVEVPPHVFHARLTTFAKCLSALAFRPHVTWLPIVGDFERMDRKSPGYSSNVRLYNDTLQSAAQRAGHEWLDWVPEPRHFLDDGYHLSVAGNADLAERIADALERRGACTT